MTLFKRLAHWFQVFAALTGAALEQAAYRANDITEARMK